MLWSKEKTPYFVLAPMADVTDPAFRKLIAKYGKPDVMWTEFVSADGLFLGGKEELIKDLAYSENERPIVAQLFTNNPERMNKAAALAVELGFDGFDINMGCPDRSIEKQGSGAAHIKNPVNAKEVILAAKEGTGGKIPVSVKTRIGYHKNELERWLPEILSTKPALVTIHARTRKELSKVPADWTRVKESVGIRDGLGVNTLIFGNGDVATREEGMRRIKETGCGGVMIGRGIFGNPWLFGERRKEDLSTKEILQVMIEHTKLFEELLPHKNFAIMKKHYKAYVNGFDGAKEFRMKLMTMNNAREVEKAVNEFLVKLTSV
jgi:nifR3 family TIM-barrel protein